MEEVYAHQVGSNHAEVVFCSAVALPEWTEARPCPSSGVIAGSAASMGCRAWHPPVFGTLKLNVDVAFLKDMEQTGVGMVLRVSDAFIWPERCFLQEGWR